MIIQAVINMYMYFLDNPSVIQNESHELQDQDVQKINPGVSGVSDALCGYVTEYES